MNLFDLEKSCFRIITIARDPAERFLSAWHWYGIPRLTNHSLDSFIEAVKVSRMKQTAKMDNQSNNLDHWKYTVSEIESKLHYRKSKPYST